MKQRTYIAVILFTDDGGRIPPRLTQRMYPRHPGYSVLPHHVIIITALSTTLMRCRHTNDVMTRACMHAAGRAIKARTFWFYTGRYDTSLALFAGFTRTCLYWRHHRYINKIFGSFYGRVWPICWRATTHVHGISKRFVVPQLCLFSACIEADSAEWINEASNVFKDQRFRVHEKPMQY